MCQLRRIDVDDETRRSESKLRMRRRVAGVMGTKNARTSGSVNSAKVCWSLSPCKKHGPSCAVCV